MVDENISEPIKDEKTDKSSIQKVRNIASKTFKAADKFLKAKQPRLIARGMVNPLPVYSKSQMMMRELFGENQHFGTGQNLPVINHALTSGGGLINNGDNFERRTAKMFGLRY